MHADLIEIGYKWSKYITQLCIILLLFADDMIIFSNEPREFHLLLNREHKYLCEWGLKFNAVKTKTKIVVFQKRRSNIDFTWTCNGLNCRILLKFRREI